MKTPSSTVRFGMVGSGLMAGVFGNAFKDDTRNTRLVGVTGGRRAPTFAAQYGVECIATFEEMLARPDIDAVVLATPHSAHFSGAIAAAQAGKHVFLEKPMALNSAECRQMVAAAKIFVRGHIRIEASAADAKCFWPAETGVRKEPRPPAKPMQRWLVSNLAMTPYDRAPYDRALVGATRRAGCGRTRRAGACLRKAAPGRRTPKLGSRGSARR